MDLLSLPHCIYLSPLSHYDENFKIVDIGYHNFQTVEPIYSYWRKQDFYTLHYVLNGEGVLKIKGSTYRIKKGQCFFVPPNETFIYYPQTSNPWSYLWFGVSGDFFKKLFESYGFSAKTPIQKIVKNLMLDNLILDFFTNQATLTTSEETMLSFFFSFMKHLRNDKQFSMIKHDELYVSRAKKLIELNYNLPSFSIEQISKSLHLSHSHLCYVFKQKTGITLKNCLVITRLKYALQLLVDTEESISHIAELCGYNSPLYFSNAVKKYCSMSPSEYRTEMRKKGAPTL